MNGRVTPLNDDFTSISPKGKAVVDYIMVSQDCLNLCTEFQVITPNDLMEDNGPDCLNLLGDRCKMPDHSLLWLKFKASAERYLTVHPTADISKTRRPRVFPDNFLSSELCCTVLLELISNIEACRGIQEDVDLCYKSFCDVLYAEMDRHTSTKTSIPGKNVGRQLKGKSFWNHELKALREDVRKAEKRFLKCQDILQRKHLRDEFKRCQHIFDKRLRFFKRRFNRGQAMHLEQLQSNNPQKFWSEIGRLGPKKVVKIPMEVRLPNAMVIWRIRLKEF